MCTCCSTELKVFCVEFVTQEPVSTDVNLYKEIAHRLFQAKVASSVNVGNNKAYFQDGKQIFGFDLHLSNHNNPEAVTLVNVENALVGITDQFDGYCEMMIKSRGCED